MRVPSRSVGAGIFAGSGRRDGGALVDALDEPALCKGRCVLAREVRAAGAVGASAATSDMWTIVMPSRSLNRRDTIAVEMEWRLTVQRAAQGRERDQGATRTCVNIYLCGARFMAVWFQVRVRRGEPGIPRDPIADRCDPCSSLVFLHLRVW